MFWLALSSWRDASPVGGESWPFDPGHLYSISTSLPSIICILQFCILLAAACLLSSVFYYQAPICPHTQLAKETEIIEALHVIHHSGNKAFMLHKFICWFLGVEERNFPARVLCKFGSLGCKMAIQSWFETWGKHQLGGKLKRPHTFPLDFFGFWADISVAFLNSGNFLTTIDTKLGKTRGMIWILDILTPMYGPQTIVRKTLSHYRSYASCPVNSGKGRYILITFTECESVFLDDWQAATTTLASVLWINSNQRTWWILLTRTQFCWERSSNPPALFVEWPWAWHWACLASNPRSGLALESVGSLCVASVTTGPSEDHKGAAALRQSTISATPF